MNHALAGLQIFKPKKHSYLSHFWLMFPFYTPRKNRKIEGSLVFSEGVKWERWREIDYATDLSVTRVSVIAAVFHQAIIHLVSTQNFPKNKHFLPPLSHPRCVHVRVGIRGKKCWFFGKFCARIKWTISCATCKINKVLKFVIKTYSDMAQRKKRN